MPNYQKGLVYKICCLDPNITSFYVGSTTDIVNRRSKHKTRCNNLNDKKHHYKVYQVIRDNGGWNNWRVMMIEEYPCKSKYELEIRERYWLELLKADLNSYVPTRTQKEYRTDHTEHYRIHHALYYEKNKEELSHSMKLNYEKNKEERLKKAKEHYEANKHRLHEKIECPICSLMLNRASLNRHTKRVHSV